MAPLLASSTLVGPALAPLFLRARARRPAALSVASSYTEGSATSHDHLLFRPMAARGCAQMAGGGWVRAGAARLPEEFQHSDLGAPARRDTLCRRTGATPRPSVAACAAASGAATPAAPEPAPMERLADVLTMLFPVWALISGTTAFFYPSTLNWITNQQVPGKGARLAEARSAPRPRRCLPPPPGSLLSPCCPELRRPAPLALLCRCSLSTAWGC